MTELMELLRCLSDFYPWVRWEQARYTAVNLDKKIEKRFPEKRIRQAETSTYKYTKRKQVLICPISRLTLTLKRENENKYTGESNVDEGCHGKLRITRSYTCAPLLETGISLCREDTSLQRHVLWLRLRITRVGARRPRCGPKHKSVCCA